VSAAALVAVVVMGSAAMGFVLGLALEFLKERRADRERRAAGLAAVAERERSRARLERMGR
jgi:hypothetical protein